MTRRTVDELLEDARAHLRRLEPSAAHDAMLKGALLVDVRRAEARAADGVVPGSIHITLDVLEWRMDPDSSRRHELVGGLDRHVILLCRQGYSSSLAARRLQEIGFAKATDVVGGFEAWVEAGLPVELQS
jgi:rhodanese-related sulfurtransferase